MPVKITDNIKKFAKLSEDTQKAVLKNSKFQAKALKREQEYEKTRAEYNAKKPISKADFKALKVGAFVKVKAHGEPDLIGMVTEITKNYNYITLLIKNREVDRWTRSEVIEIISNNELKFPKG